MSSYTAASAVTTEKAKKIILKAADCDEFEVAEAVAMEFNIVKTFFQDPSADSDSVVPVPNVKSSTLEKIVEFGTKHLEFRAEGASAEDVESYNAGFVKNKSSDAIKELILAANYLNYKVLLDLLKHTVADLISNKSVEYLRAYFGVVNDYTPEEEAYLRRKNAWAFEGVDED